MKIQTPITIVAVSDDHYSILLASMLKSIELNHHTGEKIEVYVIEDGVTEQNKKKVIDSLNPEIIVQIHWVNIQTVIPEDIQLPLDNSTYPLNVYAKLFIPYIIPEEVKRAIFLDVDMILQKDISELWNIDLKDNTIAAVQDHYIKVIDAWDGIKNYTELGFTKGEKYFNAGLIIFDTEKWRINKLEKQIIACVNDNMEFANFPEQYGLNIVFYKSWLELNPLWNFFASHDHEEPYNIHFIGRKPIYVSYVNNPRFKDIFYHYLYQTTYKNFKPRSNYNVIYNKIKNKMKKIGLVRS